MASHISHTFLNSCLKVPVDPSSSCPAPVYNRPKIYLGHLSVTPNTTPTPNATEIEHKWSCNGIRSLATFYDSIPDYREINHLSGTGFYNTIDILRSTCRELVCMEETSTCLNNEDHCSTTTNTTTASSLASSNKGFDGSRYKKTKKSKKKKKSSGNQNNRRIIEAQEPDFVRDIFKTSTSKNFEEKHRKAYCSSLKIDLDKEVKEFKKSQKKFEAKSKYPLTALNRSEYHSQTRCPSKEFIKKTNQVNRNLTDEINKSPETEKAPVRNTFVSGLRERLRKSLSYNDLYDITEPIELQELRKNNKTLEHLSFKVNNNLYQDTSKLSNYFPQNPKSENTGIPNIRVNSPPHKSEKKTGEKKCKKKQKKNHDEYKMPFTLFDSEPNKKENSMKYSTPSPVHPVARPNLAATLRLESSKKKVKELKNKCTYHDNIPQFDWEVRKTPAWKTLSFNESHKNILQLRLATRKAEQALQQHEYELNMELMRQRVKSAPLLLEGTTYWGPHVGKLSHACQKEGRRHMCQSNQQRTRYKKNSSRSQSCSRSLFSSSSSALDCENFKTSPHTYRVKTESHMSHKLNALCKICGLNGTRSRSRNSNHSTNTSQRQSLKKQNNKNSGHLKTNDEKSMRADSNIHVEINSGDELSSLDRAFL